MKQERTSKGYATRWKRDFLGVFAVVETNGNTSAIHYIHKDHLGSWTTITNGNGQVEQEASFDAWGNLRDPDAWTGETTTQLMFDRGFTGHEHLRSFGLINMNGRMYDPAVSSFLSVDAFVDEPTSAQGFNRYAYCMYNPLKYVDPSGWQKVGGMRPRNEFHDDWSNSHVQPVYEPSDFTNAYYLFNMSLYGSFSGWRDSGGCSYDGYTMDDLCNTYGYQVTHYANSVYNYSFRSTQIELIRNWQHNPNKTSSMDLEEAGIHYLSIGVTKPGDGTQSSFYTWKGSNGKIYCAEALNEYIGLEEMDSYCLSFKPQGKYKNNQNKFGVVVGTGGAGLIESASWTTIKTLKLDLEKPATFGTKMMKNIKGVAGTLSIAGGLVSGYMDFQAYQSGSMTFNEFLSRSGVTLLEVGVSFVCPPAGFVLSTVDVCGGLDWFYKKF